VAAKSHYANPRPEVEALTSPICQVCPLINPRTLTRISQRNQHEGRLTMDVWLCQYVDVQGRAAQWQLPNPKVAFREG
jgi:hypothetical protein